MGIPSMPLTSTGLPVVKSSSGGRLEGERFTTLDGQERILNTSDLTIRDNEKAVALAGIMGGENSEISADYDEHFTGRRLFQSLFHPAYQ